MHHLLGRVVRAAPALALLGLVVVACSPASGGTSAPRPATASPSRTGASATPDASGCVSQSQAQGIWTQVDNSLNAIELDPKHAGLEKVASGNALSLIQTYLQTNLVQQHVTEREVDRLDSLQVLNPGCDGGTLQVKVAMTLVRDDYLAPDGHVDHVDQSVGTVVHSEQWYIRLGSGWKESNFLSLDAPLPSQTPQLV